MIFNVLTLYSELIDCYAQTGVVGRGGQSFCGGGGKGFSPEGYLRDPPG